MIRAIVGFLLLSVHAIAGAQSVKIAGVDILEAGVYEARSVRREQTAGTSSGYFNVVQAPRLLQYTSDVTARLGTRFGYRYVVLGSPRFEYISLKWVMRYPPPGVLNVKTGELMSHSEMEVRVAIGVTSYADFTIDADHELVAGPWTFELHYEGRKLSEHRFNVTLDGIIDRREARADTALPVAAPVPTSASR